MSEEKNEKLDKTRQQNEQIEEMGQVYWKENEKEYHIQLLSIIGEVEGSMNVCQTTAKLPNTSTYFQSLP